MFITYNIQQSKATLLITKLEKIFKGVL